MIRRPPRSTLDRSSAASDVYKRQVQELRFVGQHRQRGVRAHGADGLDAVLGHGLQDHAVSYTHLRAHETVLDLVCRLLLEKKQTTHTHTHKKKKKKKNNNISVTYTNIKLDVS